MTEHSEAPPLPSVDQLVKDLEFERLLRSNLEQVVEALSDQLVILNSARATETAALEIALTRNKKDSSSSSAAKTKKKNSVAAESNKKNEGSKVPAASKPGWVSGNNSKTSLANTDDDALSAWEDVNTEDEGSKNEGSKSQENLTGKPKVSLFSGGLFSSKSSPRYLDTSTSKLSEGISSESVGSPKNNSPRMDTAHFVSQYAQTSPINDTSLAAGSFLASRSVNMSAHSDSDSSEVPLKSPSEGKFFDWLNRCNSCRKLRDRNRFLADENARLRGELTGVTHALEQQIFLRAKESREKATMEAMCVEVESLTQSLFEEANRLAGDEMKLRYQAEQQNKKLRQSLEKLWNLYLPLSHSDSSTALPSPIKDQQNILNSPIHAATLQFPANHCHSHHHSQPHRLEPSPTGSVRMRMFAKRGSNADMLFDGADCVPGSALRRASSIVSGRQPIRPMSRQLSCVAATLSQLPVSHTGSSSSYPGARGSGTPPRSGPSSGLDSRKGSMRRMKSGHTVPYGTSVASLATLSSQLSSSNFGTSPRSPAFKNHRKNLGSMRSKTSLSMEITL